MVLLSSETYLDKQGISLCMAQSERIKEAKAFVKRYLEEYRHRVASEKGLKEPSFYENYPYNITVYQFPNETIGVVFMPSDKGRIRGVQADFDDVEEEVMESERFIGFFPFEDLGEESARERGLKDAEDDLRFIAGGIEGVTARLEILEEKIEELMKLNPWLDEDGRFQQEVIGEIKSAVEGLVAQDDRAYELLRLRSFRSQPSEVEVRISGLEVLERMKEELASLSAPEEPADFGDIEARIEDIEDRLTRVGKLLPRIRDQINDLDEKIESIGGKSGREAEKQLASISERLDRIESELEEFKKEDLEVPEQIKNTVFRMNRRVYNLGKRVETIEEYLKKLSEKNKSGSKPRSKSASQSKKGKK